MQKLKYLIIITSLIASGCNFSPVREEEPGSPQKTTSTTNQQSIDKNAFVEPKTGLKYSTISKEISNTDHKQAIPEPNDNVWKEIAAKLQFNTMPSQTRVRVKLDWYARHQAYLDRVAERARPYLYYIVNELKKRDMPLDLALLPIVESAYQPFAYSPSRASGIWQFIPATGKRFGLKQNWWYDGRRDIVAATDAALNYLGNLHKRFNGDWLLAIAAYNTGERNVERAVKRNQAANKKIDFWSLKLHRETQQYVPSLLAISEIVAHPEKYNITLKKIDNQPYFAEVNIGSQIDLATVSELTNLDMDNIYTLNPGFNRWATDPKGPHRLLVPVSKAQDFKQQLDALPKEERMSWERHVIKNGDTLSQIANRYGSNVIALKQANGLRNSRIRTGRSLLIPVSKQPLKNYTLSHEARLYKGLKRGKNGESYIYKVKRGDNLWDIGRQYGVSISQLCSWNSISRHSTLGLGQKLHIQINKDEKQGRLLKTVAQGTENGKFKFHYQVQDGDSLWLISQQFGVSVNELRSWNNLGKGRYLQPGQRLNIYTNKKPTGV